MGCTLAFWAHIPRIVPSPSEFKCGLHPCLLGSAHIPRIVPSPSEFKCGLHPSPFCLNITFEFLRLIPADPADGMPKEFAAAGPPLRPGRRQPGGHGGAERRPLLGPFGAPPAGLGRWASRATPPQTPGRRRRRHNRSNPFFDFQALGPTESRRGFAKTSLKPLRRSRCLRPMAILALCFC